MGAVRRGVEEALNVTIGAPAALKTLRLTVVQVAASHEQEHADLAAERMVGQPEHRVLVASACSDSLPYGAPSMWLCWPDDVPEGGRPDRDVVLQERRRAVREDAERD